MKIEKDIKAIPVGSYQGYTWKSDSPVPTIYNRKPTEDNILEDIILNDEDNPFIIEAQMYDIDNNTSYNVKYVDGKYTAIKYSEIDADGNDTFSLVSYLGNRMDGHNLLFRRYWIEEDDEICEGMKVLQPSSLVFVGFKERKEDKK